MSAATTSGSSPPGSPASIRSTRAGKTTAEPPCASTSAAGRGLVQKTTSPGSVSRPDGIAGGEVQEADVAGRGGVRVEQLCRAQDSGPVRSAPDPHPRVGSP